MTLSKFPAVEALEQERARTSEKPQSKRDVDPNDTLPASAPASAATTSIPAGTAPPFPTNADDSSDAPLVDEAVASARERKGPEDAPVSSLHEELSALRTQVAQLQDSAGGIGAATVRVAKAQASDLVAGLKRRIRRKPLPAIGIAAVIGFVWGMTR